jgi:hypothetical protein
MQTHCNASKRSAHVINLDPAAEHFNYEMSLGTPPFAPAGGRPVSFSDIGCGRHS